MAWLLFAFMAAAGPLAAGPPVTEPSPLESGRKFRSYRATFVSCYDGDTCDFTLYLGLDVSVRQTVRFYGIDTPELRGPTREAATATRDFVIHALARSHDITLDVPQKRSCRLEEGGCDSRGRYGRLLANVIADGQSINALLLRTGRARIY